MRELMPERDLHFPPVRRTVRAKYRFSDLYQEGLLDGEVFRFADGRRQDSEVALRWVERCKAEREETKRLAELRQEIAHRPVWRPEPPPEPKQPFHILTQSVGATPSVFFWPFSR